jgi:acyl dehydratase
MTASTHDRLAAWLDDWPVGRTLAPLRVTPGLSDIVQMSIATRDFHPVHHDAETARRLGHPAPFLNIMSTSALVERFVREALGHPVRLVALSLRLGVPHHAGETLTFEGEIAARSAADGAAPACEVRFSGSNRLGRHVHGTLRLQPPAPAAAR